MNLRFSTYSWNELLPWEWAALVETEEARMTLLSKLQALGTEHDASHPIQRGRWTAEVREAVEIETRACVFFWHAYYRPDLYELDALEGLCNAWARDYEPDERADVTQQRVFLLTSMALASCLYHNEKGFSERLWEVVEEAGRVASLLGASQELFTPTVYSSYAPEVYEQLIPLERSVPMACALVWAYLFHLNKLKSNWTQAFECYHRGLDCADIANGKRNLQDAPMRALEKPGVPFQFMNWWVECQEAGDVFETLYKARDLNPNWSEISYTCDQLCFFAEEYAKTGLAYGIMGPFIRSSLTPVNEPGGGSWVPIYPVPEFWSLARGLCAFRMSPDVYHELREQDEKMASGGRLQGYFFGESWVFLPKPAQDHLINADRLYWAGEGDPGTILNELRHTWERTLEATVLSEFKAWRAERVQGESTERIKDDTAARLLLTSFLRETLPTAAFRLFLNTQFPEQVDFLLKELPDYLQRIVNMRNRAEHPESGRSPLTRIEVSEAYKSTIGIGCRGMLPKLLHLFYGNSKPR